MNLRAFSKKDGLPSISSSASKIGLPTMVDFTGCISLTAEEKSKGKKTEIVQSKAGNVRGPATHKYIQEQMKTKTSAI